MSRVGYFLEDFDDVAKRNGMTAAHMGSLAARTAGANLGRALRRLRIYDQQLRLVDARGPQGDECCHNGRLMTDRAGGPLTTVPYDFDFSGLVDAPYRVLPKAFRSITSASATTAAIAPYRPGARHRGRNRAETVRVPGRFRRNPGPRSALSGPRVLFHQRLLRGPRQREDLQELCELVVVVVFSSTITTARSTPS